MCKNIKSERRRNQKDSGRMQESGKECPHSRGSGEENDECASYKSDDELRLFPSSFVVETTSLIR